MALAELHAREDLSANWETDEMRAALAAEIVKAKLQGTREPRELRDHALRLAQTLVSQA